MHNPASRGYFLRSVCEEIVDIVNDFGTAK